MKNLKIFAPIVLLTAAYAYYEYKKTSSDDKVQALELDKTAVSKIIISKEDNSIELIKQNDNWKMLKPNEYDADSNAVEEFLELITSLKIEELMDAGDISKYGLDKPLGYFELHSANNIVKINVGSVQPLGSNTYLEKENKVYLSSIDWQDQLQKKYTDFRDKSVIDLSKDVEKIEIAYDSIFTIEKSEGKWMSSGIELSASQMDAYMAKMEFLQAIDFLGTEDNITEPKITISIHSKDGTDILKVGDKIEGRYALVYSSQKKSLVRVLSTYTDDLMIELDDLRDKKSAFEFEMENVSSIVLTEAGTVTNFVQKGDKWNADGFAVDSDKVANLIQNVSSLEIDEFIDTDIKGKILGGDSLEFKKDDGAIYKLNWKAGDRIEAFSSKSELNFTISKENFTTPILPELLQQTTTSTND